MTVLIMLIMAAAAVASVYSIQSLVGSAAGRSPAALRAYLRSLRLINYFPADNGWQYMWIRWKPRQFNIDFATMEALGANAVRITVFPSVVGFPRPAPLMQSRLSQIINMASSHGLKVQLSLFDQYTDFSDIAGSEVWVNDLLRPFAGSPRIAFIDLRNELDAPSTLRRPDVYPWVDALLPAVERDARGIPVALSVSHADSITIMRAALKVEPDFWDLHFYSPDGLAHTIMAEAVHAAAPLPVFVGETGFATAGDAPPGLPGGEASLEAYQAHYYQVIEQAALSLGLGDAAPWILYDFRKTGIPGQQQQDQYAFGLLHVNGSPKPAAEVISQLFHTGRVSQAFNNDFSQAVATPRGMLPAIWSVWEPGLANFAWDPVAGHDAPGSARISGSIGGGGSTPAFYTVPVQPEVSYGQHYSVTAWVRGRNATGTTVVNITWFNDQGVFLGGVDSATLSPGNTPWTCLSAAAVAPRGAAFAEIWLKSAHNSGTVWFDDVTWVRPATRSR